MKKNTVEEENASLRKELSKSKKKEQSLSRKLDREKQKNALLQQDLKKKDVQKITLSNEQEQLLSNLLPDIDIQNLLSD